MCEPFLNLSDREPSIQAAPVPKLSWALSPDQNCQGSPKTYPSRPLSKHLPAVAWEANFTFHCSSHNSVYNELEFLSRQSNSWMSVLFLEEERPCGHLGEDCDPFPGRRGCDKAQELQKFSDATSHRQGDRHTTHQYFSALEMCWIVLNWFF